MKAAILLSQGIIKLLPHFYLDAQLGQLILEMDNFLIQSGLLPDVGYHKLKLLISVIEESLIKLYLLINMSVLFIEIR